MADRVGQQLGNYRLTRYLGQGGFAEVYLGQHIYLKTLAAIKVLTTKLSGNDTESFLNEARTIASLIHPNIVRVLEFGIDNKTPYLVMDYAPNGTIRQRYPKKTRLESTVIVSFVKQIAAGLQYAHDRKLIHRDIKPENLLIGRNNEILLSDFGIALVAQSSFYQSTQDIVGTVAYMSPEQIHGKPRPSSDQYSLGVVVYEWLCGERPFHGTFTELCTQHMFATPIPLHQHIPTLSAAIEQVVNTALAKDPKQRFATVQAFANALEQASKPSSELVPSISLLSTVITTPPRRPSAFPQLASMVTRLSTIPQTNNMPFPTPPPPDNNTPPAWEQGTESEKPRPVEMHLLVTMAISTLLFALCYYGLSSWTFENHALVKPILPSISGTFSFYFTSVNVLFGLILTIPLFFAVEAGPWVGLVSVIVGNLLGDYIVSHQFSHVTWYHNVIWYYYVTNALQVCIPGFALFRSGQTPGTQKISRVLLWTALAIVISSPIAVTVNVISNHYSVIDWFGGFFGFALSGIFCLIALPILISAYNAIVRKRNA